MDSFAMFCANKKAKSVYLVSKPIFITTFYRYFFCIDSEICKDILEHKKNDVNSGSQFDS